MSSNGSEFQLWCQQAAEAADRRAGEQKQVEFLFLERIYWRNQFILETDQSFTTF